MMMLAWRFGSSRFFHIAKKVVDAVLDLFSKSFSKMLPHNLDRNYAGKLFARWNCDFS
jgi:hypothetical protein